MTKNWIDFPQREDLRLIPAMIAKGWEPDFSFADKALGRTTPAKPPLYFVSFRKGNKYVYKNGALLSVNRNPGHWHGTEKLPDGETKFTIYNSLNDVLYGTSII